MINLIEILSAGMKTDPNYPECAGCARSSHNAHCAWATTNECVDAKKWGVVSPGLDEVRFKRESTFMKTVKKIWVDQWTLLVVLKDESIPGFYQLNRYYVTDGVHWSCSVDWAGTIRP
jgi:hypothetical protein